MDLSCWISPLLVSLITILNFNHHHHVLGEVIALNENNVDSVLASSDVALVNFYADWCRFSQILAPIFEEAAKKVSDESTIPGKIVFAKVDCDRETSIGSRYRISKYPTLKLFRGGVMMKKEYRGQRSAEALASFIQEQAKDTIHELPTTESADEIERKKRVIVAFVDSKQSDNYRTYARVSNVLRDDCEFYAVIGPASQSERPAGDRVIFKPTNTNHQDEPYTGQLSDYSSLHAWAVSKCTPLVREITFENAEELTEEGLPFLILFRHPDDKESEEMFIHEVTTNLIDEKTNINFLVADGIKFAHPLHHLGKGTGDLPLICIDSFRHMYLFSSDVKRDIKKPGLLKQFVLDLHSGKLHREFHHGPDPTTTESKSEDISNDGTETKNIPRESSDDPNKQKMLTSPPESTFVKLAPSRTRYTILRDEL